MFESKTESESTAEPKTECGAYFMVHSHGDEFNISDYQTQLSRILDIGCFQKSHILHTI